MNSSLTISKVLINESLDLLHKAARLNKEGIVVWFAPRSERRAISNVFVPIHEAGEDYFHITPEGNRQLREICQTHKLVLEAQVHTHPKLAFHSEADDKFAVVRHVDALSIVLPHFALKTTAETFLSDSASYYLDANDHWIRLTTTELHVALKITD